MRTIHSVVGLSCLSLLTITTSLDVHASSIAKPVIISNEAQAINFQASSKRPLYLIAATFKSTSYALRFKEKLAKQTPYPISIKEQGLYHIVVVGPIKSANQVRKLAQIIFNKTPSHQPESVHPLVPKKQIEHHVAYESLPQKPYMSKMGPIISESYFRPFLSGEGLFSWPQVHGYTITLPAPGTNTGVSHVENRGWGGRVAVGLMHSMTDRFAYSGEIGWGYYGHTSMPITFEKPLTPTQIAAGIQNTTGTLDRWGLDILAGALYTQPKYDLYFKAGALLQNLRVGLSNMLINESSGSISTNSMLPEVLPEIKLGADYHVNEHLSANLSWMYAFGGPFDVTLPYNNIDSTAHIGAMSSQLQNPSMNVMMFGLEYRFG